MPDCGAAALRTQGDCVGGGVCDGGPKGSGSASFGNGGGGFGGGGPKSNVHGVKCSAGGGAFGGLGWAMVPPVSPCNQGISIERSLEPCVVCMHGMMQRADPTCRLLYNVQHNARSVRACQWCRCAAPNQYVRCCRRFQCVFGGYDGVGRCGGDTWRLVCTRMQRCLRAHAHVYMSRPQHVTRTAIATRLAHVPIARDTMFHHACRIPPLHYCIIAASMIAPHTRCLWRRWWSRYIVAPSVHR